VKVDIDFLSKAMFLRPSLLEWHYRQEICDDDEWRVLIASAVVGEAFDNHTSKHALL